MKKLVAISILFTLLAAAAFAQFKVGLEARFDPDLLRVSTPTGDAANADYNAPDKAPDRVNPNVGYYGGTYSFDFLSASDFWEKSDLDLNLSLNKDNKDAKYGGLLQINAQSMVQRIGGSIVGNSAGLVHPVVQSLPDGTYWVDLNSNGATDSGEVFSTLTAAQAYADANYVTNGTSPNLIQFLSMPFGDFEIWGKVGIFTGKVGNTADRGFVNRYEGMYNAFLDEYKIENYGVQVPVGGDIATVNTNISTLPQYATTLSSRALDVNNLARYYQPTSAIGAADNKDTTYIGITAAFDPISVAIAGDLSRWGQYPDSPGLQAAGSTANSASSWSNAGSAIRVSGSKIADLVTFDAIYKFYGSDENIDDKFRDQDINVQPDGLGIWNHSFGLYANIDILEGLGLGLGYSGYFRTREDIKIDPADANTGDYGADGTYKSRYPYFSGIDLRVNFSAVERLNVTLNNNLSFSSISNDDNQRTITYSVLYNGGDLLGPLANRDGVSRQKEVTESYLGLYNALGISYAITDALTASVNIANKLATYNNTNDQDENNQYKLDLATDTFITTLAASYSFDDHVSLTSGLAFQISDNTLEYTGRSGQKYGNFTFGIPIRFKVVF